MTQKCELLQTIDVKQMTQLSMKQKKEDREDQKKKNNFIGKLKLWQS